MSRGTQVPAWLGSDFAYAAVTLCGSAFQRILLSWPSPYCRSYNPGWCLATSPVWAPPRSLATTCGISVDVFSCPYLDVSVQFVPPVQLFYSIQVT